MQSVLKIGRKRGFGVCVQICGFTPIQSGRIGRVWMGWHEGTCRFTNMFAKRGLELLIRVFPMVKHDQIEPTVDGLCYPVGASAFAAEWWEGKEAPEGALGQVAQGCAQRSRWPAAAPLLRLGRIKVCGGSGNWVSNQLRNDANSCSKPVKCTSRSGMFIVLIFVKPMAGFRRKFTYICTVLSTWTEQACYVSINKTNGRSQGCFT